jgi:hypothetical protein
MIQPHEFIELVDGIEKALLRFESTSNHAVLRLYRRCDQPSISRNESKASFNALSSMHSVKADERDNSLTDSDHEHVFLVYL